MKNVHINRPRVGGSNVRSWDGAEYLYPWYDVYLPVSILRGAVNITEGADIRHILGDEADLVHRVMVQTILHQSINQSINQSIITNLKGNYNIIAYKIIPNPFPSIDGAMSMIIN